VGGFGNIVAGAILRNRKNFRTPLQLDMVGVADRFGISGNPWELVQYFGLTAEHIAKRVLDLLDRKQVASPSVALETTLRCTRCGAKVSLDEYAKGLPLPSDEICAECEHQSTGLCAICRLEWARANQTSPYVCLACRAKPVLR